MLIDAEFYCAYCGERNDTTVDPSAGDGQEYVEDCQVCCRPNRLWIELDEAGGARIEAAPEKAAPLTRRRRNRSPPSIRARPSAAG